MTDKVQDRKTGEWYDPIEEFDKIMKETYMTDKVIVDGHVAVLVSPGYGGGWSTRSAGFGEFASSMVFEPKVVEMVLAGNRDKIGEYLESTYPGCYVGSVSHIRVEWVPVGTKFCIDAYDGSETLVFESDMKWQIA